MYLPRSGLAGLSLKLRTAPDLPFPKGDSSKPGCVIKLISAESAQKILSVDMFGIWKSSDVFGTQLGQTPQEADHAWTGVPCILRGIVALHGM